MYRIEGKDNRPFINIEMIGVEFKALFDTGSIESFISDGVTTHLMSSGIRHDNLDVKIKLADI